MRIAVLGSTGSIGRSTLALVAQQPERLQVEVLAAAGNRTDELLEQVRRFRPATVVVADRERADRLAEQVPAAVRVRWGEQELCESVTDDALDRVVAAMVGAAGLEPIVAALGAGTDVALANKEALVAAGPWLLDFADRHGARLLPVDSEPVALDQALRCGRRSEVKRLIITASGGPFRKRPLETWDTITPEEALEHPTWTMGPKISIDSATLINKALELIEASYLFRVEPERIEVVVHPESVVHSVVEFCDGSSIAQLAPRDMAVAIQYALAFPDRWQRSAEGLSLVEIGCLSFEPVDGVRFRGIELARSALAAGHSAVTVLSAADEVAVAGFLDRRLRFPEIVEVLERTLDGHRPESIESLEQVRQWDRWGRQRAAEVIAASYC